MRSLKDFEEKDSSAAAPEKDDGIANQHDSIVTSLFRKEKTG
jgi:hypothetical protein